MSQRNCESLRIVIVINHCLCAHVKTAWLIFQYTIQYIALVLFEICPANMGQGGKLPVSELNSISIRNDHSKLHPVWQCYVFDSMSSSALESLADDVIPINTDTTRWVWCMMNVPVSDRQSPRVQIGLDLCTVSPSAQSQHSLVTVAHVGQQPCVDWNRREVMTHSDLLVHVLCFFRRPPSASHVKSLSLYPPTPHPSLQAEPEAEDQQTLVLFEKKWVFIYLYNCIESSGCISAPYCHDLLGWSGVAGLFQLELSAHWARRHCALVLMKIGQICICCSWGQQIHPPFMMYSMWVCPLMLHCNVFVFKVQWKWLPMGQVDITYRLYYHNGGGGGARREVSVAPYSVFFLLNVDRTLNYSKCMLKLPHATCFLHF